MKKTKPAIEVGQIIYVRLTLPFIKSAPKLHRYKVVRVNTRSIYAIEEGEEDGRVLRLDKKTMKSKSSFGTYTAYLTEKEYWDMIELAKEKETLRREVAQAINSLSIEKLREIKTLINSQEEA